MARNNIQYYYDQIAQEASSMNELNNLVPNPDTAQTFLNDITSPSKVAEHRVLMWIFAFFGWLLDTFQQQHESEVSKTLKGARYGRKDYYINTALLFQFGDSQVWQDDEFVYTTLDPSKQIIKYADQTGVGKVVNIKFAKDSNGAPAKLSSAEETAFIAYYKKHEIPGLTYLYITQDPDQIKIELDVVYDPQLIDSSGVSLTDGTKPVETAINDYLNAVKFNSNFETVDLIDFIQAAEGVVRPYIVSCEGKAEGGTYGAVTRSYTPISGHMVLDSQNTTINYISNV